jgi:hypothetical protein
MQAYHADGTPSAVVVRPDGTIGSPLAQGAAAIRALVARTAGGPIPLPIAPTPANGGGQAGLDGLVEDTAIVQLRQDGRTGLAQLKEDSTMDEVHRELDRREDPRS